jgi:hypothetical protein
MILVKYMAEWVADELLNGNNAPILLDSPFARPNFRPPAINGHVPDLYVDEKTTRLIVIGEAKTSRDLETERSENQLRSFIKYCSLYSNSILVLAVPWYSTRSAKSLICMLERRMGVEAAQTKVLDMLPG